MVTNIVTGGSNRADWFTYFTYWNCILLSVYFLLSSSLSIYGIMLRNDIIHIQSPLMIIYSKIAHTLFEVCGGSEQLVMVIAFSQITIGANGQHKSKLDVWNLSIHLVTVITLFIEMVFNDLYVRLDHYPINLAWGIFYLIFIWLYVYFSPSSRPKWPYFFLETEFVSCFYWYSGILALNFLFYLLWFCASELKFWIRTKFEILL